MDAWISFLFRCSALMKDVIPRPWNSIKVIAWTSVPHQSRVFLLLIIAYTEQDVWSSQCSPVFQLKKCLQTQHTSSSIKSPRWRQIYRIQNSNQVARSTRLSNETRDNQILQVVMKLPFGRRNHMGDSAIPSRRLSRYPTFSDQVYPSSFSFTPYPFKSRDEILF